jgi:HNH endonuclease
MICVVRNDQLLHFEVPAFWDWARAGNLLRSDQVESTAGAFHPATAFADLLPLLPPEPAKPSVLEDVLKAGLAVGGVLTTMYVLGELFKPRRSERRPTYLRPANTEPVRSWKRLYVYERDGGRCTYCGVRLSFDAVHVDHSVSRANRGTNHLNNLRTACRPCNLEKGPLNARQFLR